MSLKENQLLRRLTKWKNSFLRKDFPLEFRLGTTDVWVLLFLGCVSLFMTKLLWFVPIYIFSKATRKITVKKSRTQQSDLAEAVTYIELNQLQLLTEAVESNPALLHCEYRRKTLLSWCKFYHNTNAFMIVSRLAKKSQSEQTKQPIAA